MEDKRQKFQQRKEPVFDKRVPLPTERSVRRTKQALTQSDEASTTAIPSEEMEGESKTSTSASTACSDTSETKWSAAHQVQRSKSAVEIRVPDLTEAGFPDEELQAMGTWTMLHWFFSTGAHIEKNAPLGELRAEDGSTTNFLADVSGTLRIRVLEGHSGLRFGDVIGFLESGSSETPARPSPERSDESEPRGQKVPRTQDGPILMDQRQPEGRNPGSWAQPPSSSSGHSPISVPEVLWVGFIALWVGFVALIEANVLNGTTGGERIFWFVIVLLVGLVVLAWMASVSEAAKQARYEQLARNEEEIARNEARQLQRQEAIEELRQQGLLSPITVNGLVENTLWNPHEDPIYKRAMLHPWNAVALGARPLAMMRIGEMRDEPGSSDKKYFLKATVPERIAPNIGPFTAEAVRVLRRLDDTITNTVNRDSLTHVAWVSALVKYIAATYRDRPRLVSVHADLEERLDFLRRFIKYRETDRGTDDSETAFGFKEIRADTKQLEEFMYVNREYWGNGGNHVDLTHLDFIYKSFRIQVEGEDPSLGLICPDSSSYSQNLYKYRDRAAGLFSEFIAGFFPIIPERPFESW